MLQGLIKRAFSAVSKLDHLLSLPASAQKHQQLLELIDTQTIENLKIDTPSTIASLARSIIQSESLKHIKQMHKIYRDSIALSLEEFHSILNVCEQAQDIDFSLSLYHAHFAVRQGTNESPQVNTLNKLLSIAIEHLQAQKRPHQPGGELTLWFPSDFEASYRGLEAILQLFEAAHIALNEDSLKMIIGHFIHMEDFEAAFRFFSGYKAQLQSGNNLMLNDLVCYFVHVALNESESHSHYRNNAEYCFKLAGLLQTSFPILATELMIESFVHTNSLSLLKRIIAQEADSTLLLRTVPLSRIISCALKYRDWEFCLKALVMQEAQPSAQDYALIFGSFLEFNPNSLKNEKQKEAELQAFLNECRKHGLEQRDSELREGLAIACMKWDASILQRLQA